MVYMKLKYSNDNIESAVVHSVNNRIENIYWIRNDSLLFISDITYDKQGNLAHLWKSPQEIKVYKGPHYSLDKNGNVIKAVNYSGEGTPIYTEEFERFADGTIKEKKGLDAKGKLQLFYSCLTTNIRNFQGNIASTSMTHMETG